MILTIVADQDRKILKIYKFPEDIPINAKSLKEKHAGEGESLTLWQVSNEDLERITGADKIETLDDIIAKLKEGKELTEIKEEKKKATKKEETKEEEPETEEEDKEIKEENA